MAGIIAAIVGGLVLTWFLRRLFPALAAAAMVLLAPLWLLGGFLLDLIRGPMAFLRPLGVGLARAVGFVLVLLLLPFIFVWSFCAELWRQFRPARPASTRPDTTTPVTPMKAATRRAADVIDMAAFRQRRNNTKE
ncbi:TPA: hypothetical protein ACWW8V_004667 [Escherichia coli]